MLGTIDKCIHILLCMVYHVHVHTVDSTHNELGLSEFMPIMNIPRSPMIFLYVFNRLQRTSSVIANASFLENHA